MVEHRGREGVGLPHNKDLGAMRRNKSVHLSRFSVFIIRPEYVFFFAQKKISKFLRTLLKSESLDFYYEYLCIVSPTDWDCLFVGLHNLWAQ